MKRKFTKNWIYTLLICFLAFVSTEKLEAQTNAGTDQTVLCGSTTKTITLTGTPIGGTWSSSVTNNASAALGTTNAIDGTVVVTLPVAPFTGTLTYTYTYTDNTTSDVSVFVNGPTSPIIDLHTGTLPFACDGKTVQLCPKIFGYSKYQWYKNGSAISGVGESSCITLDVTGIGNYTLAGNDGSGCWSQPSAIFIVKTSGTATAPSISITNNGGSSVLCSSTSTVTLSSDITSGIEWYKDGVATSITAQTITVDQAKVGDYTVLHTDASSCGSAYSNMLTVSNGQLTPSFIISNLTPCAGTVVNFTSTTQGTVASYSWDFGNGFTTPSVSIATYTYTSSGTQNVGLKVTNACGTFSSSPRTITVKSALPTVTISGNTATSSASALAVAGTLTLSSNAGTLPASQTGVWASRNTAAATVNANGVVTGVANGIALIVYRVTSDCGLTQDSTNVYVGTGIACTAKPAVDFTLSGASTTCITGNAITATATSTGNAVDNYAWNFGDGTTIENTISFTSSPHSYQYAGTYTVSLVASNSCGILYVTASTAHIVTLVSAPVAQFSVNNDTQCKDVNSFQFYNSSTGTTSATTYSWDFGDHTSPVTSKNASYTYPSSGSPNLYFVVLTATTAGCPTSAAATKTITLKPSSVSSTALTICSDKLSYNWNGTLCTAAGTWVAHLSNYLGCDSAATLILTVNQSPIAPAAITGTLSTTVGTTTLLANTTPSGIWSVDNVNIATVIASGIGSVTVTGVSAGSTRVNYTVSTTSCGSASVNALVFVTGSSSGPCVAPIANFSVNNKSQCLTNNSFVFTDSTTGMVDTWTWNFGDGSSAIQSPTHTYLAAGTYTVTLQPNGTCGGGTSKTITVTVIALPNPVAGITGTTSVSKGKATTLTTATAGGSWTTSTTGANFVSILQSTTDERIVTVTGNAVGTATISYTIPTNGCGTSSKSIDVNVTMACVTTTSTTNKTICDGQSFSFNGSSYTTAGSYTKIGLINYLGCDSTATLVLTVNSAPNAPSAIISNPTIITSGTISMIVNGTTTLSSGFTGVWYSNNPNVADVSAVGLVTAKGTGGATITYTESNDCGSKSVSVNINVGNATVVIPPTPPVTPTCNLAASIILALSAQTTQCITGNKFIFESNNTGGTAPFSYQWYLNDNSNPTTPIITQVYSAAGDDNVRLRITDKNGCTSDATSINVKVGAKPTASFSILPGTGPQGKSTTFISSSTISSGNMSYAWYIDNNLSATIVNPMLDLDNGLHAIKLRVTGDGGVCTDEATQSYIQADALSVTVYPNPITSSSNSIQLTFVGSSGLVRATLSDLNGTVKRMLNPLTVTNNVVNFNISGLSLPSGSYVINIVDLNFNLSASKIVIKN